MDPKLQKESRNEDKKLKCEHCSYETNIIQNMNSHKCPVHKIKTGGTKYICKFCPYMSVHKGNLNSHIKAVHMRKTGIVHVKTVDMPLQ